jgi:Exo-beta-D-glucosaminidase Ig-fold domain/Glycosyl hydrolases family 2/F5/8 type C domain/Glycosyl hydrolases family 2, sugar binding domain
MKKMHLHKRNSHSLSSWKLSCIVFLMIPFVLISSACAQEYTRGVGVYPGDLKEDFSPSMKIDSTNYRNLALHRPAYHSSSYNYNLTAQLITDGIKESQLPGWIVTTTSSDSIVKRIDRERVLDRHTMTRNNLDGHAAWLQIEMAGNSIVPDLDSINISGSLLVDSLRVQRWNISVLGSQDGARWKKLGTVSGDNLPGDSVTGQWRRVMPSNLRMFNYPFALDTLVHYKFYKVKVNSPNAKSWAIAEFALCHNGKRAAIGGPYDFTSAWMSASSKVEWVYVDLGAECLFDRVVLNWIRRPSDGSIQISDDATQWKDITLLPHHSDNVDDVRFDSPARGRYVRVLLNNAESIDGYILSELEVFGIGGPIAVAHPQAPLKKDGRMDLAGGDWKLQRESLVHSNGETLSKPGFIDNDWVIATVPATVLVSYLDAGALPDPNFSDNQLFISDSYFYSDFWYRNEFIAPASYRGKRMFLNFDGINWKAEVYLNGHELGLIEGAFTRGQFDVTDILLPGENNVLAVRIKKNDTPGFVKEQTKFSHDANGGEIGADNPTFHASVGWDWIPTIRGRNIGIYKDVYLSAAGPVTIEDPFVSTDLPLPDTTSADITLSLTLHNHTSNNVTGIVRGTFGTVRFEQPVILNALEAKNVKLNTSTHPSLRLKNPKLWWPNGYGQQNLYNVELKFITTDGGTSDSKTFRTGIREMSYSEDGGVLKIWVNGKRFIGFGGNWGFSESMLRYRKREYDIAVRYHKEMNFTMIRNWVGQVADDEFYEACDRYGIMIWQDFWLANPVDGPNPDNNVMFMQNVDDFVKRIRNHPSLALYVGRNEGNPPAVLDSAIRKVLPQIHPDVHYISNSAFGVVSGGGPYRAMPVKFYFEKRATERLHSEMGMPNMVSYESLHHMIPDSALWPINRLWGVHDFNLESAQYGSSFIQQITDNFGQVNDLKEWLSLAQWINYQGYRAMFEAQSKYRMGLLLWMSHSAWPSMVWQTYDYYFEPTAAYFGCKKACEPLHIQWNPLSDSIEVVNYRNSDGTKLTAMMEILDLDGSIKLKKKSVIDCPEDHTILCWKMEYPADLSGVYFIRLTLKKGSTTLSENLYWRELKDGDLKAVRDLPKVKLRTNTKVVRKGKRLYITTTLINKTKQPALMVKLNVVGNKSKERMLPVIFSDNFISLMPGEKRIISMELQEVDTRGEHPIVIVEER